MTERFHHRPEHTRKPLTPPEDLLSGRKKLQLELLCEITTETYMFFKEFLISEGYTEFTDVNAAYRTLPASSMIVRREDPRNVLQLFSETESYDVGFVGDERYSNCVEWNPQADGANNLGNAYAEGFTNLNNVVTVIGFEKSKQDDVLRLPDATDDAYGLNRAGVRSFKGEIAADRVAFINLRIPGHLLPESELTDEEIDRVDKYVDALESGSTAQPIMIHRSYIKNNTAHTISDEQRKEAV